MTFWPLAISDLIPNSGFGIIKSGPRLPTVVPLPEDFDLARLNTSGTWSPLELIKHNLSFIICINFRPGSVQF